MNKRRYIKNKNGVYVYPFYFTSYFYFLVFLFLFSVSVLLGFFRYISYLYSIFLGILLMFFLVYYFAKIKVSIKIQGSLKKVIQCTRIKNNITYNFLNSILLKKENDKSYVDVPVFRVYYISDSDEYTVEFQRFQFMREEDIIECINHAFRCELTDFSIYDFVFSDNSIDCVFYVKNVNSNERIVVEDIKDIIDDDLYTIVIQKNLMWHMNKNPHLIITGKTGSGKTTFLFGLLMQFFYKKYEVYIIDPKHEFFAFSSFFKNVYSVKNDILTKLDEILVLLKNREKQISEKIKEKKSMGLSAADLGFKPVVILFDEYSAFVSLLDSKERKAFDSKILTIIQRGRSSGVFLIVAMQNANSEYIKVAVRNQFSLRILLGNSTMEDIHFMFSDNHETVNKTVERFTGYYMLDGVTINPQKLYITDIFENGYNTLNFFENLL